METIPVDIWKHIVGHLSRRDLLILATISPQLRNIVQALLYHKVHLSPGRRPFQSTLFNDHLTSRPELGAFVHSLRVCGEVTMPVDGHFPLHPILATFSSKLCNLHSLLVTRFLIDSAFCATIATQFPRLVEIDFRGCQLGEDVHQYDPPRYSFTKLSIFNPLSLDGWTGFAHAAMQSLTISHYISAQMDTLLSHFGVWKSGYPTLTELNLPDSFTVNIIPFLTSTPRLRRLSLPPSLAVSMKIPEEALPFLEYVAGPADCVAGLAYDRPIKTAKIYIGNTVNNTLHPDVLLALRRSTASVTEIALSGNLEGAWNTSTVFSQYAPSSLHTLLLEHFKDQDDIILWVPALSLFPFLCVLTARATLRLNKEKECAVVKTISEACHAIREVRFLSRVWHRETGVWKAVEY